MPSHNEIIADKLIRLDEIAADIDKCMDCDLFRKRNKSVPGHYPITAFEENVKICFVGEGPGSLENVEGEPFVGRSGEELTRLTIKYLNLGRPQYFIVNCVCCKSPENRPPTPDEIFICAAHTYRQIGIIQPDLLIMLGASAIFLFVQKKEEDFSIKFGEHRVKVTEARNKIYDISTPSVYNIESWKGKGIATYHPSGMLRGPQMKALGEEDYKFIARQIDSIKVRKEGAHVK